MLLAIQQKAINPRNTLLNLAASNISPEKKRGI
jgi:hypothetical protein